MQLEDLREIDIQIQGLRVRECTLLNQMIELKNQYISARLSKADLLGKRQEMVDKENSEALALVMELRSIAEQEEIAKIYGS